MSKAYAFEFLGTKEDFLNRLNGFSHNTSYSGSTNLVLPSFFPLANILLDAIRH